MKYAIEVWTIPLTNDEEPCEKDMVECKDFISQVAAGEYAWERLEEGFFVRMFRR